MKFDFKKVAMNALVVGGTGAAAQVIAEAIDLKDPSMMDYIFAGAGVVLPAVVKNETVEKVGDALLAVGAYRIAQTQNLAGKLGFNAAPATSGIYGTDIPVIGTGWRPERTVYASAPNEKKNNQEIVK